MHLDQTIYLLATQPFLHENRDVIFFTAVALSLAGGMVAAFSPLVKKLCIIGFFVTLIFPLQNISFMVDPPMRGVPSARGLYFTLADLFVFALVMATMVSAGAHCLRWRFPGVLPYVAFIGIGFFSIMNMTTATPAGFANPAYIYGIFELSSMLKGFLVFWVMVNYIRSDKEIRLLLYCLVFIVVVQILFFVKDRYVFHMFMARYGGTMGHPNGLAMFIGMILPLILVITLGQKRGGLMTWIMPVLFLLGSVVMFSTVSRGGLAGFALSVAVALALLIYHVGKKVHALRTAVIVFIIGCCGAFVVYHYWDRVMGRFTHSTAETDTSTATRIRLLEIGGDMFQKSPVIGHGLNSFPILAATEYGGGGSAPEQHNLYLLMLSEIGLLGLFAFVAIVFRIFQTARRLYRQHLNPAMQILAIGLICGLLHDLVESGFEFLWRAPFISYTFYTICAMIVAMWLMYKDQAAMLQATRLAYLRRMAAAGAPQAARAGYQTIHR